MSLAELAAAFEARALSREAWTHAAHLRVALWYVDRLGPALALGVLRERIRALNLAQGGANTATGGYHETLTAFWVDRVARERARRFAEPVEAVEAGVLAALSDSRLPLRWWSRERLMSREARAGWVAPDLRGLED